jgi:hypothetical protein
MAIRPRVFTDGHRTVDGGCGKVTGKPPILDGGCGESIEVDRQPLEVRERAEAQGTFMCSAQDHARRTPRLQRFLPPRCAQTPAITGLQSGKAEVRDGRREIVAAGLRILEKSRGHDGAHGVAAEVLAAGVAAAVAKETRHRAQGADRESIAEHIFGLVAPAAAPTRVVSQHWNSLHRRSLPRFENVHSV